VKNGYCLEEITYWHALHLETNHAKQNSGRGVLKTLKYSLWLHFLRISILLEKVDKVFVRLRTFSTIKAVSWMTREHFLKKLLFLTPQKSVAVFLESWINLQKCEQPLPSDVVYNWLRKRLRQIKLYVGIQKLDLRSWDIQVSILAFCFDVQSKLLGKINPSKFFCFS